MRPVYIVSLGLLAVAAPSLAQDFEEVPVEEGLDVAAAPPRVVSAPVAAQVAPVVVEPAPVVDAPVVDSGSDVPVDDDFVDIVAPPPPPPPRKVAPARKPAVIPGRKPVGTVVGVKTHDSNENPPADTKLWKDTNDGHWRTWGWNAEKVQAGKDWWKSWWDNASNNWWQRWGYTKKGW